MSKIYFVEPYTGTRITYDRVHNANEFRWKDKNFPLKIAYEGPKPLHLIYDDEGLVCDAVFDGEISDDEKELYLMYEDFVFLLRSYE